MSRTPDQWFEDLMLELRLRGADGPTTGDVVATARAHCAESGEDPRTAFGEPRAYAESLELPAAPRPHDRGAWVRIGVASAVGLSGALLAPRVAEALRDSTDVHVRWGDLTTLPLVAAVAAVTMAILPALLRRPVLGAVVLGGMSLVVGVPAALLGGVAFRLPMPAAMTACALLLLTSTVLLARATRDGAADPVVDPVTRQPAPTPLLTGVTSLLFVLVAGALVALALLPGAFGA